MAPSIDWYSGAIRTLLKRFEKLESRLSRTNTENEAANPFIFDPDIPEFIPQCKRFPRTPPGVLSVAPIPVLVSSLMCELNIFDNGEQYEYGDVETHAIDVDTSDFSPHQFIAPDEARDAMGSDDNEQNAASKDAARAKILSPEVFDSENVPSPDNFIQKRVHLLMRSKHMPDVDEGEQYEYGDVETHAIDADTADWSPHQFIAPDAMGSDDNEQDAANNDAARTKILSAEVFDSDDVPSPDNFIQKKSIAQSASNTCQLWMMVSSMSMSMGMWRLMPLTLTHQISLRISFSRQTRHVLPWATTIMSRMLPTTMLPGPTFCLPRFSTVRMCPTRQFLADPQVRSPFQAQASGGPW